MSKEEGSIVAGAFWSSSPVVAITSKRDNEINGQIAVTVVTSSVIHSVPRLIVGIWKGNYTHSFIYSSKKLCIHLLNEDQLDLVRNFGFYTGRDTQKFRNLSYKSKLTGCPVLNYCHSYAECEVINGMDGGDMTVFLVNVINGGINSQSNWMTLEYFYNNAPYEWIQQYSRKLEKTVEISMPIIHNIEYNKWKP